MHIFRFVILLWVTTPMRLHASLLEKHIHIPHTVHAAALYYPFCLKHCVLAPVSLKHPWTPSLL